MVIKHELNIWVVGGDLRQANLARLLAEDGHTVHLYALEHSSLLPLPNLILSDHLNRIHYADCVILPLPVCQSSGMVNTPFSSQPLSLSGLLEQLSPKQFLFGGRPDIETITTVQTYGLTLHDYFAREELAVANAVPTAEGALQLAMEQLPITIHGARVLILGFGRVGRITAKCFSALGAKVTVGARKYESLAWASSMGFEGELLSRLSGWLFSYDLIINTVPALLLGQEELKLLRPDCLILDLASAPGGVDLTAANALGINAISALSLPGKVAPASAGRIIRDTIYHMLCELGL